jgi:osmotically-inducible protein OsmY
MQHRRRLVRKLLPLLVMRQTGARRDDMQETRKMIQTAQAALERRPEINLHRYPIALSLEDGVIIMRGEVENIVAKRLARRELAGLFGVEHVLDQLSVRPGQPRGDGAIAVSLEQMLRQERALRDYSVSVRVLDAAGISPGGSADGSVIAAGVHASVVLLEGVVESLSHRRLVDVLAWWTPGVSGVENHVQVSPPQHDSDAEMTDALRMVLEKDPLLDAGQIKVRVDDRRVTLEGLVPGEAQRNMALADAWYVLGVHDVDNRLQVRVPEGP